MIPSYIFDLDGVLVDVISHINSFAHILCEEHQITYPINNIGHLKQSFNYKNMPEFYKKLGLKLSNDFIQARYLDYLNNNTPEIFPELNKALNYLQSQKTEILLISDSKTNTANKIIRENNIEKIFTHIRTRDLTYKSDDYTEITRVINKHIPKNKQIIVVGDQVSDSIFYHLISDQIIHECKNVLTTYGLGIKEELIKENPDFIIESPSDLSDFILNYSK